MAFYFFMNLIKNNIKGAFSVIPNALINDNTISDRARFLFIHMASKPDDWVFYNEVLCKAMGYGEDTLRKYVAELSAAGWLTREQIRNKDGQFDHWAYTLYPQPYKQVTVSEKDRTGKTPSRKKSGVNNKDLTLIKKEVNNKESERTHENLPEPMQDWVEVAQAMAEYAEGEGATQWRFMCQVSGYNDKPIKILSTWASKAQQYDLKRWRENFPKLLTWMKNERNNQPNQPSNIKKWTGA